VLISGKIQGISVSPSGGYIALISNTSGEWGLWIATKSGETVMPFLTLGQGFTAIPEIKPRWSADGRNVMLIGQFIFGYQGPDVIVVLFKPEGYRLDPFSGEGNVVFTRVTGGQGIVTSFSPSPTSDSLAYAFTLDGISHLWILLKAKPVSPYGGS
jgi:Tol biopolymer transport system component